MRKEALLSALAAFATVVLPTPGSNKASQIRHGMADALEVPKSYHLTDTKQFVLAGKDELKERHQSFREFVGQHDIPYELVKHPEFLSYKLRVTEPSLCDPSVKQLSGYLDVAEDKHLFFWFFEARNSPSTAPFIVWLNGGPGCSSSTGLLFELGPCSIQKDGLNVTQNPYSWNEHANILFLDQPVNVGFSYADGNTTVDTSPVAGRDFYAFLQLFFSHYPQYSKLPFHLAAESAGGTYGPNFASIIYKENKKLKARPNKAIKHINLVSLVLANPLTNPLLQYPAVPEYACDGPFAFLDPADKLCKRMKQDISTCERLFKQCYTFDSVYACYPAFVYCNEHLFYPVLASGRNPYDVRKLCTPEQEEADECYPEMNWVNTWMNRRDVKANLGVHADFVFRSCNMTVNQAFEKKADEAHNTAALLPELINDGVRLLVYAGDADVTCNYIGNDRWVDALETTFAGTFRKTKPRPWTTLSNGRISGTVRSAGPPGAHSAGNVTFVRVFEAGHLAPFDQPEAAYDLINRWISDIPIADGSSRASSSATPFDRA